MKEAVDNAIESAGPGYDCLIDGVLYYKGMWLLVCYKGYKIEGTPIKTTELIIALKEQGIDPEKYLAGGVYHSSLGIDNSEAIKNMDIIKVKE